MHINRSKVAPPAKAPTSSPIPSFDNLINPAARLRSTVTCSCSCKYIVTIPQLYGGVLPGYICCLTWRTLQGRYLTAHGFQAFFCQQHHIKIPVLYCESTASEFRLFVGRFFLRFPVCFEKHFIKSDLLLLYTQIRSPGWCYSLFSQSKNLIRNSKMGNRYRGSSLVYVDFIPFAGWCIVEIEKYASSFSRQECQTPQYLGLAAAVSTCTSQVSNVYFLEVAARTTHWDPIDR